MDNNKIYVVIVEDRHIDTMIFPYSTADKAIDDARAFVTLMSKNSGVYEEHDYGIDEGWLYYGQYTYEGDNAHVVTAEIDGGINA